MAAPRLAKMPWNSSPVPMRSGTGGRVRRIDRLDGSLEARVHGRAIGAAARAHEITDDRH